MNTVSENFESLTKQYPSENQATKRLSELFINSSLSARYSARRLFSLLEPQSAFNFPVYLNHAVKLGILNRRIGVLSPTKHQNLEFFSSLESVPEKIYDHLVGEEVEVTPDLIEEIYSFDRGAS